MAKQGTTITAEKEIVPGLTMRVEIVDSGAIDHLGLKPATVDENPLALMPLAGLFGQAHHGASQLIGQAFEGWKDDVRTAAKLAVRGTTDPPAGPVLAEEVPS